MIDAQNTPLLLVICLSYLILTGVLALTWGRRFEKQVPWLIWSGILVLVTALCFSGNALFELNQKSAGWPRGWIWPRMENGAITVGILQDYLGLVIGLLSSVAASVLLLNCREYFSGDSESQRPERIHAGIAFSLAGVSLAWLALTPWLAITGLTLVTMGGFLALGSRWDSNDEADLASDFLWQRSWGLILVVLGAGGLVGSGMILSWQEHTPWVFLSDHLMGETVGIALLLAGLFIQFHPFPFLAWLVRDSRSPVPVRTLLIQTFPAWAAFSVLIRIEPSLRSQAIFQAFGWVQLASALLTLITGFAQKEWRLTLGVWQAAGFSVCAAGLVFSGPGAALALLLGTSLGGMVLSFEGSALAMGGSSNPSSRTRAKWAKALSFFGAAAATGMLGFVSTGGVIHWVQQVWHDPYLTGGFLAVAFLFLTLGWKLAWSLLGFKSSTRAGWLAVLSPIILILLSLGCVWTGSATGGAVFGSPAPDQLFISVLDFIAGASSSTGADESIFWASTGTFWATLLIALSLALWISRKPENFKPGSTSMISTAEFLRSGYRTDRVSAWGLRWISRAGVQIQWLVDQQAWGKWVPGALAFGVKKSAAGARLADEHLSRRLRNTLQHSVEIPSKVLQLIQSGDVQWYLVFAIASGIAILVHFLRVP